MKNQRQLLRNGSATLSNVRRRFEVCAVLLLAVFVVQLLRPAQAATSFVKSAANDSYGPTVNVTFSGSVTAGNVIAAFVGWYPKTDTLSSLTATCVSGAFTLLDNPTTGVESRAALAYGVVSTTGPCTVTATASAGTAYIDAIVHEISGVDTSSPLDNSQHRINAQAEPGTGANAVTTGNITTTQNGDYIFGAAFNEGLNGSLTVTAGTGYNSRQADLSGFMLSEDRIQPSAGTVAATFSNNLYYASFLTGIMAFRPAAGGTPSFDFTLSNGGNKSVVRGSSTTNTIAAALSSGTAQPVTFTTSGLPAGTTASYNPTACSPTCSTVMTINTTTSTPLATSTITVTGTAGSVSHTTAFALTVTSGSDTTAPAVSLSAPAGNAIVSGTATTVSATASDNVGVAGVQFLLDSANLGAEDTVAPYSISWNTTTTSNGQHVLSARARDAAGNTTTSKPVTVTVDNQAPPNGVFQNEILATGMNLPTSIEFLPNGDLLILELGGRISKMRAGSTEIDPTPFLQLTNVGSAGVQQGLMDMVLDPDFETNRFYYVFYTAGTPNRDRTSRFTANADFSGTVAGSELVLYQDPQDAHDEHHGGALNFASDGKLYITTGEHFDTTPSQLLTSPRGKILRINRDGTIPGDNPFHDGGGPNVDSIWALGLRNPFRAYIDPITDRFYIGDVGGNDPATSYEEVNLGVRGANYGWAFCEGFSCGSNPAYTSPIYAYPHSGRDASVTGGFVYHGSQFPAEYQGSFFFGDYAQNWIRRLTFDADGNVTGVFNFLPPDGSLDGPYGDIVALAEGPDGALYYVDLGYSDTGGTTDGISKIRRIRFVSGDQPPVASASADVTSGPAPLTVRFSSAGSSDPEGRALTYLWDFGDGSTSPEANPAHVYSRTGPYQVRLSVSDGTTTTLADPIIINVGNPPVGTILTPADGSLFRAGDVITFSGSGTDVEDGELPPNAFTWNIDFLHAGHVHPGVPQTGVTSGSFEIPTDGHEYNGSTRFRITLTVTDSNGLQHSSAVTIYPAR
jgi:glucose/arabinose dehydrogenase